MKMSKFKLAVLVLLAVTVIYAVALALSVQAYRNWRNESLPKAIAVRQDYLPFFASSAGKPYLLSGIALALCWIFAVPLGVKDDMGKLAAFFLAATIWGAFLFIAPASATEILHVDVLCVADEEFNEGSIWVPTPIPPFGRIIPLPVDSNEWAETQMEELSEYFLETFQIEIHWHHWLSFDSNDANQFLYDLLVEAKREKSLHWSMRYDGENMELMMIFTQQSLHYAEPRGAGYPWWRICAIRATLNMENVMLHEIGHQFDLEHCSNSRCAMWGSLPMWKLLLFVEMRTRVNG